MEFESELEELFKKAQLISREFFCPIIRKESLLRTVTICTGIFCGIFVFANVLDMVRLIYAYHFSLPLTRFIIKLGYSATTFGLIAIIIYILELEWKRVWGTISAIFLLFNLFFQIYSRLLDMRGWIEISEIEFIGNEIVLYFAFIAFTIINIAQVRKQRKKWYELIRSVNSFCKEYPEHVKVLKSRIKENLVDRKSLRRLEKKWQKVTGDKF